MLASHIIISYFSAPPAESLVNRSYATSAVRPVPEYDQLQADGIAFILEICTAFVLTTTLGKLLIEFFPPAQLHELCHLITLPLLLSKVVH
jgi:hypothetical protein